MAKIYAFHSPKTAGNTIICLNMALAYQFANPKAKVALLTCTRYPELATYLNLPLPKQTLHQLLAFAGSDEWSPRLLDTLAQNQIVDCLPSPRGTEWKDFTPENWESVMHLVTQTYDVIFVDLGRDIPHFVQEAVLSKSQAIITTSCLDPVGLSALEQFLEQHKALKSKQYLLINQAPKEAKSLVTKHLKKQSKMILGMLPFEHQQMWDQVYKGFPLALQKKSAWKKALLESLDNLQKL